jgi:hypothetical protein
LAESPQDTMPITIVNAITALKILFVFIVIPPYCDRVLIAFIYIDAEKKEILQLSGNFFKKFFAQKKHPA